MVRLMPQQMRSLRDKIFCLALLPLTTGPLGQSASYPHNAVTCTRCHNDPTEFGASAMSVRRVGASFEGRFIPTSEGGIHHRNGESVGSNTSEKVITGERIALNLLGDGFIEAIDDHDIEQSARWERAADIVAAIVSAPIIEAIGPRVTMQIGRFGWKSQHSSLMSSCADSLRNELGVRNRLYPDEYPTHAAGDNPTPFDTPDPKTHQTELERLVDEIRHTSPPARDANLATSPDAQAGERLFAQAGCAVCHVPTYKTLRPGTRINGGTYKVPKFLGNKVIHP
jgi:cytochrome c553